MITLDHTKVLDWITKDYETWEYYKNAGKELYLVSNGDSALTRYRLADLMRRNMSKLQPGPVKFETWNDDCTEIITVEMSPAEITTSNEAYVDWLRLADYMLLAAAGPWEKLEQENQRRRAMYEASQRGYEARMNVEAVAEYLKENSQATDKDIKAALNRDGPEVLQVHIQQAKKIPPPAGSYDREIIEQAPEVPAEIGYYKTLYF